MMTFIILYQIKNASLYAARIGNNVVIEQNEPHKGVYIQKANHFLITQ